MMPIPSSLTVTGECMNKIALEEDPIAREIATRHYALPPCLHVPIAAVDRQAISNCVGEVIGTLNGRTPHEALLVRCNEPPEPDPELPIWGMRESYILHASLQVWVHVAYTAYRSAYRRAFPSENLDGLVLSHAMNRRVAKLKNFDFVRITPVSRAANSSSAYSEQWGVDLHSKAAAAAKTTIAQQRIAYADLTEVLLMMGVKLGGGNMDVVNDAQALVSKAPS